MGIELMIKNATHIELELNGRKYHLFCDPDSPLEDVKTIMLSVANHVDDLLQKSKEPPPIVETENLPVQDLSETCCGKTLC